MCLDGSAPTLLPELLPSPPPTLQAAEHMRDTFEQHGADWFAPCPELHSGPVFHAASEPRPAGQQQQQAAAGAAASSDSSDGEASSIGEDEEQQQEAAWQSQWAAHGWLQDNPLVRVEGLLECCLCLHQACKLGQPGQAQKRPRAAANTKLCAPRSPLLNNPPLPISVPLPLCPFTALNLCSPTTPNLSSPTNQSQPLPTTCRACPRSERC